MLHIGTVLDQRYHIDYVVKQGGMGTVYGATDLRLDRPCAVKAVTTTSAQERAQIEREARVLGRLCHPHLPAIYDCLDQEAVVFVVMQMIPGEDLEMVTGRAGPPSWDTLLGWALQLAEVVQYLHEQTPPVIHRDIKPANIRLAPHGQIYLVDFGIAKLLDGSMTVTAAKAASVPYAPIEQIQDDSHTTQQSDIYAFGATLYRLLTSALPPSCIDRLVGKDLQPITALNRSVPEPLAELVHRCMELWDTDRPASMAEVIVGLHGARASAGAGAPIIHTVPLRKPTETRSERERPEARPRPVPEAFETGKAALDRGDTREAVQLFSAAIERQPRLAEAYAERSRAYGKLGDARAALKDLDTALTYEPERPGWYVRRATLHRQAQNIAAALADLSTAVDLNPELAEAYWQRAQLRRETGDGRGFQQDLDRVLQLAPDHRSARLMRAQARMEQQLWQGALPDCNALLQHNPEDVAGYILRAKVYRQLGDTTRALRDLSTALTIDSRSAEAYYLRARLEQRSGDRQAALRDFNLALAHDPDHIDARYRRAQLLRLLGSEHEALAEFRTILGMLRGQGARIAFDDGAPTTGQRTARPLMLQIQWLMQNNGIEKARRYLHEQSPKFSDESDDDLEERAALYERVGQIDAALDDLERAIKLLRNRRGTPALRFA